MGEDEDNKKQEDLKKKAHHYETQIFEIIRSHPGVFRCTIGSWVSAKPTAGTKSIHVV